MSFQRLAAVCVFVPGLALAADLGRLTVQSGAGEPMRAIEGIPSDQGLLVGGTEGSALSVTVI